MGPKEGPPRHVFLNHKTSEWIRVPLFAAFRCKASRSGQADLHRGPFTEQGWRELQMDAKVLQCISQHYQILEFGIHEETGLWGVKWRSPQIRAHLGQERNDLASLQIKQLWSKCNRSSTSLSASQFLCEDSYPMEWQTLSAMKKPTIINEYNNIQTHTHSLWRRKQNYERGIVPHYSFLFSYM